MTPEIEKQINEYMLANYGSSSNKSWIVRGVLLIRPYLGPGGLLNFVVANLEDCVFEVYNYQKTVELKRKSKLIH